MAIVDYLLPAPAARFRLPAMSPRHEAQGNGADWGALQGDRLIVDATQACRARLSALTRLPWVTVTTVPLRLAVEEPEARPWRAERLAGAQPNAKEWLKVG